MKKKVDNKHLGFLAGGFLLGTLGIKALTSPQAKDLYVRGIASGMRAKQAADELVERAKENVDDIVAEAEAVNDAKAQGAVVEVRA